MRVSARRYDDQQTWRTGDSVQIGRDAVKIIVGELAGRENVNHERGLLRTGGMDVHNARCLFLFAQVLDEAGLEAHLLLNQVVRISAVR